MSSRIDWIDTCKGFGILFMVWGHTASIPNPILIYIYSFHMPLFFFLSGFLFSIKKDDNFRKFAVRKTKSLLIPFFVFSIFSIIPYVIYQKFSLINGMIDSISNPIISNQFFRKFFYLTGDGPLWNGSLWFLTCMFLTQLLFYWCQTRIKNHKIICLTALVFSLIGYFFGDFINFRLPWGADIALTGFVFMFLGFTIKESGLLTCNLNLFKKVGLLVFIFLGAYISLFMNSRVDMRSLNYGNYFLFYMSAISGIFACIKVSQKLKDNFILRWLGQNSLLILCLHPYMLCLIENIQELFLKVVWTHSWDSILLSMGIVFLTLIACLPVIILIKNYMPWVMGKNKKPREVQNFLLPESK